VQQVLPAIIRGDVSMEEALSDAKALWTATAT
jgi:hypothetical protein